MYAITFDLVIEDLKIHYHNSSYNNAYSDIQRLLSEYGFTRQQGSVYFGDEDVTPVTCVNAVQDLEETFPWFIKSVRDIRMLRIEENNDLSAAFKANQKKSKKHRLRLVA